MSKINAIIAGELAVPAGQVDAAVDLLDGGATVPFIARYRKEATGGLDDGQLRTLEERLGYLRELEERRGVVLKSIEQQGKLTPELEAAIAAVATKVALEDLYLPYKPKRRTKAQMAREAGLEGLADALLADPERDPEGEAAAYVNTDKGVEDHAAALEGARHILVERFSEDAALVGELRAFTWKEAEVAATVVAGKEAEGAKFSDYFDYWEPLHRIPSHRALALFRGRNEGVLSFGLRLDKDGEGKTVREGPNDTVCRGRVARAFDLADRGRPADAWLLESARLAWRTKIWLRLEVEMVSKLREEAEEEAIKVFAANLRDLLLAAPAGDHTIIGLDPGIRTGVKVAVVDGTGKLLDAATLYPHPPRNDWEGSIAALAALAARHRATLVSIGNGTASRETDRLVGELVKRHADLGLQKMVVSEAGASVYSASELAAMEFPDLDVSLRGAVSIARRLQDPLAELVKIEPKAIGVGQYQHDVNQSRLGRCLHAVVEDCVNAVGVDLNTASAPLLTEVSGLNKTLAANIVAWRQENGPFPNRRALLKVPRLGPKAYEQAAGFLRIRGGTNPLDASAVHPEAYPVVQRILETAGRKVEGVIGDRAFLGGLDPAAYTDEKFGVPTVRDILAELEKPGRDPRPEFRTATFQEGVERLEDLQPGMQLEGVVTNVTNFGAFVDIGVHQDGLVHISALADRYVEDPREVVKAGDVVKVKVLQVDPTRRRIGLTMRLQDEPGRCTQSSGDGDRAARGSGERRRGGGGRRGGDRQPKPGAKGEYSFGGDTGGGGAMADLFGDLKKKFKK